MKFAIDLRGLFKSVLTRPSAGALALLTLGMLDVPQSVASDTLIPSPSAFRRTSNRDDSKIQPSADNADKPFVEPPKVTPEKEIKPPPASGSTPFQKINPGPNVPGAPSGYPDPAYSR